MHTDVWARPHVNIMTTHLQRAFLLPHAVFLRLSRQSPLSASLVSCQCRFDSSLVTQNRGIETLRKDPEVRSPHVINAYTPTWILNYQLQKRLYTCCRCTQLARILQIWSPLRAHANRTKTRERDRASETAAHREERLKKRRLRDKEKRGDG